VIELPAMRSRASFIFFEQPYGEFFQIGEIERALSGLPASVKPIEARNCLKQDYALSSVIFIGQDSPAAEISSLSCLIRS